MNDFTKTIVGNIVDIPGRSIFPGRIVIENGKIASITPDSSLGSETLPYILPGFIDSHIHIESTLMVPENYARLAVANGVTAAVCDPHEIANVLGMEGVDYMIENGKTVRFNFHFTAPSCVPSTPFETAGAALGPDEISRLIGRREIVGLAEMMNVPGVVYADKDVMAKVNATHAAGKPVDGHAPKISGDMLKKYVEAGITTDHECETQEEATEKIALGMKILIREGSAARDFDSLYPLIGEYPGMTMFCSDDMYPDDAETIGYINGMVKRSIENGMPLWETLECACTTPVRHYGLGNGMLQQGDSADFIVVSDLKGFEIRSTYVQGHEVYNAETGISESFLKDIEQTTDKTPNKFNAKEIEATDLKVEWQEGMLKVITAKEGSLITGKEMIRPEADNDGFVKTDNGIAKLVVYDRYNGGKPQVAYIKGFNIHRGAIASTIAHDCHNIIAIGCSDEEIATAINRLVQEKGGLAACDGSRVECLPLPVAGLMGLYNPEDTAVKHLILRTMANEMGCSISAPFMTLAFMALPVIPELKLTDKGLFDGNKFEFTSLWE